MHLMFWNTHTMLTLLNPPKQCWFTKAFQLSAPGYLCISIGVEYVIRKMKWPKSLQLPPHRLTSVSPKHAYLMGLKSWQLRVLWFSISKHAYLMGLKSWQLRVLWFSIRLGIKTQNAQLLSFNYSFLFYLFTHNGWWNMGERLREFYFGFSCKRDVAVQTNGAPVRQGRYMNEILTFVKFGMIKFQNTKVPLVLLLHGHVLFVVFYIQMQYNITSAIYV